MNTLLRKPALKATEQELGLLHSEWYSLSRGHYEEHQQTIQHLTSIRGPGFTPVLLHSHTSGEICGDRCLYIYETEGG